MSAGPAAVGTTVAAYETGHAGDPAHLIGQRDLTPTTGFGGGTELAARIGLGHNAKADVVLTPPTGASTRVADVAADDFVSATGC